MAISLKATGAWATAVADATPALVGTPVAGDRYFLWASWKAFGTTASVAGWTEVTEFADGSVAAGSGTGSVKIGCWYRDWQSGDGNPTLDFSVAPAPAGYVMQLWQKGAGDTWIAPTFVTAAWPATSITQTVNASSTATVGNGAVVMCVLGLRDDSAVFTRLTTAIAATSGVTWTGNYVESPATHLTTATSNDMAADLGHRFVTTGGSGITLQVSATISAVETGAALWVIQGLGAPPLTVDAIDPVGITDFLVKDAGRDTTDSTGITDFLAKDFGRSAIDAVGITDSITVGLGFTASATNTVGVADSAGVTQDWVRSQTDPVGISDSATVTQDWVRSATDLVGLADEIAVGLALTNSATDSVGITDVTATAQDWVRIQSDSVDVTDSLALTVTRDITSFVGITDSATFQISLIFAATDPVGTVDAVDVTQNWVRSEIDSLDFTDTVGLQRDSMRDDLAGITDSVLFQVSIGIEVSDTVGITDTAAIAASYEQSWIDPVGIVDTTEVQGNSLDLFDVIGISDVMEFAVFNTPASRTGSGDATTRVVTNN